MKKTALLIDGGYLRESARSAGHFANPDFIEAFAHSCIDAKEEQLYRILYYDCPPYKGEQNKPISGEVERFDKSGSWLDRLAARPYFAVRRGELQWRGWKLKIPIPDGRPLTDDDFRPDLPQKGVDMRIGLDIASLAHSCIVSRLILVSADTDFIPAMKYGRVHGLQIVLTLLPAAIGPRDKLLAHADIFRPVKWPVPKSVR